MPKSLKIAASQSVEHAYSISVPKAQLKKIDQIFEGTPASHIRLLTETLAQLNAKHAISVEFEDIAFRGANKHADLHMFTYAAYFKSVPDAEVLSCKITLVITLE